MDFESYLMSTGYVDEEIAKVTSGIKSVANIGSQLIFTLNDNSTITVTIAGLSDNNYTTIEKNKLGSINSTLLNRFTYVNNKLLFDGNPIEETTVDLSNYASKNGDVNENFSANNITLKGNIMPLVNGTQDIGSPDNRFGTIYVNEAKLSTNTLYLGDTPVMGTNQDTIMIKGDTDQSIAVKTTGVGTTKVISGNGVELSTSGMNANVTVQATGSGSNTNLSATNQVNLNAPNINIQATSTDVKGAMAVDNLTIRGDVTINGGATTIQSTTVQVEDNIIELNKGEVGYGVTAGRSGIKIDRGDADDYLIIFDETDDSLKMGTDTILQKVASENYVDSKDALKANLLHNHSISDITNLQSSLDDIVNVKPINYIYVGKNGDDTTGDGSANKPYLTVQKAIDIATSGTTIFIFPATYNENLTFKAGVYLTTSVKYGVYITGNHVVDYTGTCIVENIVLNSNTGITLSFQGINTQNFQLLGCSVDSTNGHAISWSNTNASSKIYSENSITNVSASSSTAKCFYAPSTAKGSVIANRYSFKINNPDNIALDIGGSLSFTHTGDQIIGQILVSNSASTTFASLSNTTLTTPVLTTNSTGMTTMINTVINTMSNPAIAGSGAFSYVAILYANTGVGGASSLNGGLGAISLPMSSLKLRNSTLLSSSQISSGNNSGAFEFNGTDLYFTKGISRDKIAMIGDIPSVTNKLETTNIKAGTNITVTTSGNDVTINSTASGGTVISTWDTFNL